MRDFKRKDDYLDSPRTHASDKARGENQKDMVQEANRIIKESLFTDTAAQRRDKDGGKRNFFIPFFIGALTTLFAALILYMIFAI